MSEATDIERVERFLDKWGRKARFAIEGPDGRFSTAWAVWEKADSVYIAGRTIGGFLKVSLHLRDRYRLAFTKEFHPRIKDRAASLKSRDLAVWPRPDISKRDRPVLVASVCFPTDFLRSGPPPSSFARPYLLLQAPPPGRAAYMGLFESRAPLESLEPYFLSFGKPFIRWDFDDGSSISMVAWEGDFDRATTRNLTNPVQMIPLTDTGRIEQEHLGADLTALLINEPGPGIPLRLVEFGGISAQRSQAEPTA